LILVLAVAVPAILELGFFEEAATTEISLRERKLADVSGLASKKTRHMLERLSDASPGTWIPSPGDDLGTGLEAKV